MVVGDGCGFGTGCGNIGLKPMYFGIGLALLPTRNVIIIMTITSVQSSVANGRIADLSCRADANGFVR